MRVAGALLLLAISACRLTPEPRPPTTEGEWAVVRERMTRSGKLYDGLATNAFARVVYLTLEVRETRTARLGVWKTLSLEEVSRLLLVEREEAALYDDFLVFLFTPTPGDNDLDSSQSVWRLALVPPGAPVVPDVLPTKIEQLRLDSMIRNLHPEIGDFDIVYRVRFPRQPQLETKPFTFRMAGAKGRLDFAYGPGTAPPR